MPAKKKTNKRKSSAKMLGKPVLVVLKDGSYYIGTMSSIDRDGVTLSGVRSDRMPAPMMRQGEKAQVSGILSMLFGGSGRAAGPGAARGGSGGPGMFGFFGKIIPNIRIGMNVMRAIMPLMGGFFK
ncbi:hypothetical protein MUG84_18560 [Paenibacillus sp. KQZ6P-2]|uniref:Uncharacterized protein n=1 Tax=Paenibacillus mangrovi TaxID=2931978 RepID=A0A9X1WQX5_9BACL|nr:hypothetical protein [Paenibacillus mangrovi]MCJ8013732.1 hypothetical protein [Paenibacillus mangrovi]